MNIRKRGNSEKLKFPSWVEGTFGDDVWWGGGRRSGLEWGVVGAGGAMAGSQMGQGVGASSARWQGREGMAGAGGPDGGCWGMVWQEGGGTGGPDGRGGRVGG